VSAKNGVSRQLNVNKSHDIQFPWAVANAIWTHEDCGFI
jgi:hypothetical protein